MTFNERVHAVSEFGFTTRQARFLVSVMLHGGVCLPRQYARLAGTAYGHKVNVFFDKLVTFRYAVRCRCVHNRAAVYHVRHQPLYRAIGQPHNRNRKPVPAARLVERLMLLDAVISHPDLDWLSTATDKVAYFSGEASSDVSRGPSRRSPERAATFRITCRLAFARSGALWFSSWQRLLSLTTSQRLFGDMQGCWKRCLIGLCDW